MSVLLLVALAAHAHVGLEEPPPRYPTDGFGGNKACPCGVGESNRYCDVETDRSDPDRNLDAVTTYTAGDTITMRFHEVVAHAGRYRVAFDPDGADMADFNAHILLDVPDPAGSEGNVGQGDLWELQITLPDTPCDNCTLQLVQMMDGNTTDPVPDPIGRSSYYQCADIVLEAPGVDTDTALVPDTDVPIDTDAGAPIDTDAGVPGDIDDDGATCGCANRSSPAAQSLLPFLVLVGLRRRQRTRQLARTAVFSALLGARSA